VQPAPLRAQIAGEPQANRNVMASSLRRGSVEGFNDPAMPMAIRHRRSAASDRKVDFSTIVAAVPVGSEWLHLTATLH